MKINQCFHAWYMRMHNSCFVLMTVLQAPDINVLLDIGNRLNNR
jgi:hypothetical protein